MSYVPLIAPSTSLPRIRFLASIADSFIYVVSKVTQYSLEAWSSLTYFTQMGTTGSSKSGTVNTELPDIIARVRQYATVPLAIGFGVSTREHFDTVAAAGADAVVIGSRLVDVIRQSASGEIAPQVESYCRELSLKGQAPAPAVEKITGKVTTPIVNAAQNGPTAHHTASDPSVLPARFGQFGGQYVPEALVDCLVELEAAHKKAMSDPEFWAEWNSLFKYMNRPSNLYLAENLTKIGGGAKVWLKREDL
jgi:tryptophan synthase